VKPEGNNQLVAACGNSISIAMVPMFHWQRQLTSHNSSDVMITLRQQHHVPATVATQ